jgi:hypothetical protein
MAAALLGAGLLVCACATAPVVDPANALNGRQLDTALSLYGPYEDRVEVDGRSYYVWRKVVEVEGQHLGCELHVEVAYRSTIRSTRLDGYAGACSGFSVRYTSKSDRGDAEKDAADAPDLKTAGGCSGCRPVGSPTTTARSNKD